MFRIKSDDSIMCRFYCIRFHRKYECKKKWLDYTMQFIFPCDYKKNDKIIYKHRDKYYRRKRKSRLYIKKR